MQSHNDQEKIDALVKFAEHAGASQACSLPPASVQVEDRLAVFCREPKCPYYGQSMSCPPHVSGPKGIRKLLQSCKHALVIRIEIQSASLHGADRPAVMRLLHEITAEVELEAKRLGFPKSIGFAGGSCKPSFCPEHSDCRVLTEQGECRHPHHARTSMSGYGVNVGELMKSAGWSNRLFSSDDKGEQLAWVAGLVLMC